MSNLQKVVENPTFVNEQTHRQQLASLVNSLMDGKSNAIGTFTLDANQASTVVLDNLFDPDMVPLYMPLTANASAEIGAGSNPISSTSSFQYGTLKASP